MLPKILVVKHYGLCVVPFNQPKYLIKWSEALKICMVFEQPRKQAFAHLGRKYAKRPVHLKGIKETLALTSDEWEFHQCLPCRQDCTAPAKAGPQRKVKAFLVHG